MRQVAEADEPQGRTSRRRLLAGGLSLAASTIPLHWANAAAILEEPPHDVTYVEDFDELWETLGDRYCFFGEKMVDWNAVRSLYRPLALTARTDDDFARIVDGVCRELYDAHTYRHASAGSTPVRRPYLDIWVEPAAGGTAIVTSVREDSVAAGRGIRVGERITAVDGTGLLAAAAPFAARCLTGEDAAATSFAMNVAVSERSLPRRLSLIDSEGKLRSVVLPMEKTAELPVVESRLLPGGFGCIVIRSFADETTVAMFDDALLRLRNAPGLILDVRRNGGGDTAYAKPIMGRFIKETATYAHMRRRDGPTLGPFWTENVQPRGPYTYEGLVVVLASRWSASMAEGFPMGMRSIGRATIVGTEMMRVGAGVWPLLLDRTGTSIQYSAEPVYDALYKPRWLLEPDVPVRGGGDILAAGVAELARQIANGWKSRRK